MSREVRKELPRGDPGVDDALRSVRPSPAEATENGWRVTVTEVIREVVERCPSRRSLLSVRSLRRSWPFATLVLTLFRAPSRGL
jgi:hypothetical protein